MSTGSLSDQQGVASQVRPENRAASGRTLRLSARSVDPSTRTVREAVRRPHGKGPWPVSQPSSVRQSLGKGLPGSNKSPDGASSLGLQIHQARTPNSTWLLCSAPEDSSLYQGIHQSPLITKGTPYLDSSHSAYWASSRRKPKQQGEKPRGLKKCQKPPPTYPSPGSGPRLAASWGWGPGPHTQLSSTGHTEPCRSQGRVEGRHREGPQVWEAWETCTANRKMRTHTTHVTSLAA